MTTSRRTAVLAAAIVIAVMVGGLAYSRFSGDRRDGTTAKAEDTTTRAPVTKATTPSRKLNEKEQLIVGTWKFENLDPKLFAPGYQAEYEFASDGSFMFSFRSIYVKHWSRRGEFRITGDILIKEGQDGTTAVNLIDELTQTRLIVSAQDGTDREVQHWARVR